MDVEQIDRTGQNHLPPVLKMIADPGYHYSREKHHTKPTKDGILHTYSVRLSCKPFDAPQDPMKNAEKSSKQMKFSQKSDGCLSMKELVSQISSTTTSERKKYICTNSKSRTPIPHTPQIDPSHSTIPASIPKLSHSSKNMKNTCSGKFVMMVQVKLVLLHHDIKHNIMQSCFVDEFTSDCLLQDIVRSFHDLCLRQNFGLKATGDKFNPRMSYCIGELNNGNSKPVMKDDLKKTLAELAASTTLVHFALIVNILN